jgi:hypothetical protein
MIKAAIAPKMVHIKMEYPNDEECMELAGEPIIVEFNPFKYEVLSPTIRGTS